MENNDVQEGFLFPSRLIKRVGNYFSKSKNCNRDLPKKIFNKGLELLEKEDPLKEIFHRSSVDLHEEEDLLATDTFVISDQIDQILKTRIKRHLLKNREHYLLSVGILLGVPLILAGIALTVTGVSLAIGGFSLLFYTAEAYQSEVLYTMPINGAIFGLPGIIVSLTGISLVVGGMAFVMTAIAMSVEYKRMCKEIDFLFNQKTDKQPKHLLEKRDAFKKMNDDEFKAFKLDWLYASDRERVYLRKKIELISEDVLLQADRELLMQEIQDKNVKTRKIVERYKKALAIEPVIAP